MAADPIVYCLDQLTDYAQFERLCHDIMSCLGYTMIEPLGGNKDKGRDALHVSKSTGETTVFAYSVREDWSVKLKEDAAKVRGHGHQCEKLVFVTTAKLTAPAWDDARRVVQTEFGFALDIFSSERLRALLTNVCSHLVSKHPQIFNPALFTSPVSVRSADLVVQVSPTRMRRRQLAQIRVFNKGNAPVFLEGWTAAWREPEEAVGSRSCLEGSFPCRLLEQDAASFLVDISDHSIEMLIQLGVIDGESRAWYASEADVRRFVATAIEHAPPPSTSPPKDEALSAAKVDVRVKRTPRASKPDLLEVVFVNLSEINIALRCALIEWKRDGLDSAPVDSSEPSVREVERRVSLSPINSLTVLPGGECIFRLSDSNAEILLSILRLKIEDLGLCVGVVSTSGLGWKSSGPKVAADIRAVAQSVIATWDE